MVAQQHLDKRSVQTRGPAGGAEGYVRKCIATVDALDAVRIDVESRGSARVAEDERALDRSANREPESECKQSDRRDDADGYKRKPRIHLAASGDSALRPAQDLLRCLFFCHVGLLCGD